MSKYGVFSGPYFPVFGLNTGKYGPEKTPYLDTFHAVVSFLMIYSLHIWKKVSKLDHQYIFQYIGPFLKTLSRLQCLGTNKIIFSKYVVHYAIFHHSRKLNLLNYFAACFWCIPDLGNSLTLIFQSVGYHILNFKGVLVSLIQSCQKLLTVKKRLTSFSLALMNQNWTNKSRVSSSIIFDQT